MSEYQQINPKQVKTYVIIGAIVIGFIIFIKSTFVILQPTERGVIFRKYSSGLDVNDVKTEGLNIIAPWNDMIIFSIDEQTLEETMDVLSQDGLSINIDVSIRFSPSEQEIGYLYKSFKMDYANKLVRQELRSAVRSIIGEYTPEELYSTKRQEIEGKIQESTEAVLAKNYVKLHALLFRSIKLPETIKNSIEEKLKADQESQKREYMQQIAEKDAAIQITQARGKAESNRILSASLTDKILQEKGIAATEALANSPNTKVIVIGGGKDGLPLILNADK